MKFRPLDQLERTALDKALRGNVEQGLALLTDRKDTSFKGTTETVSDEEVITAIKSVPTHY